VKESPAEFATSLLPGSEANVEKGGNLAAHEDPTSVDSVPVPEEHWNRLPLQKKIVLLLPDEDSTWSDSVAEFPSDWQKRVEEAVSRTLKQTRKIWDDDQMSKKTGSDEMAGSDEIEGEYDTDCEPDDIPNMSGTTYTGLPLLYERFIEKLPQCTPLHFGFHESSLQQGHKRKCYCPCSKKMKTWRRQFGLEEDIPQCNGKSSYLGNAALLAHLKSPHRCGIVDFHQITSYYLQNVYDLPSTQKRFTRSRT
jgi:hypothetical protein